MNAKALNGAAAVLLMLLAVAGAGIFAWGFVLTAGGLGLPAWRLTLVLLCAGIVLAGAGHAIWRNTTKQRDPEG